MYKFNFIDDDKLELVYTNKNKEEKRLEFERTINDKKKFEEINVRAEMKLKLNLTRQGLTKDDFVIVTKQNGKTIYNEQNYNELKDEYVGTELFVIIDEIIRDKFNMSFDELWLDMGYTNENKTELQLFIQKFSVIINGGKEETVKPSKEN